MRSPAIQLGRNTANVKNISSGKVLLKPFSGSLSPSQKPLQKGSLCFQNFSSHIKWLLRKKKKKTCYVELAVQLPWFPCLVRKFEDLVYNSTSVLTVRLLRVRACVFLIPWGIPAGLMIVQSFLPSVFVVDLCKCDLQKAPGPSDSGLFHGNLWLWSGVASSLLQDFCVLLDISDQNLIQFCQSHLDLGKISLLSCFPLLQKEKISEIFSLTAKFFMT